MSDASSRREIDNHRRIINYLIFLIVVISCVLVVSIISNGFSGKDENYIDYKDLVSIILTALGTILAVLAIILAIFAFVGWHNFQENVSKSVERTIETEMDEGGRLRPMLTSVFVKGFSPDGSFRPILEEILRREAAGITGSTDAEARFAEEATQDDEQ
jgi:uncharacterized membrane protein